MKRSWIVLVATVLLAIGLGVGVSYIYHTKQTSIKQQTANAQTIADEQHRHEVATQEAEVAKLNSTISVLRAECLQGQNAYNLLTTAQKAKLTAITCDAGSN